jgi:hypothetical protein
VEWRFLPRAPTDAEEAYIRTLAHIWGWTDPGLLWVRQSAGNLRDAPVWWAEYTHEVAGRELTIHQQGEPLTLTFYDPESATVRVMFALLVRVYHDASGLFLERISYPGGTLTLGLQGLLDTTPQAAVDAAWRGREILAHIGGLGPGRRRNTGWIDGPPLDDGLRRTIGRLWRPGALVSTDDVARGFYDDAEILARLPLHRRRRPEDPSRQLRRLCRKHLEAEFSTVVSRLVSEAASRHGGR